MIVSAAIVSQSGEVYLADFLPEAVEKDIQDHANSFFFTINRDGNSVELPYIETSYFRYVYKETGDLYWLMVTKTESNLQSDIDLLGKFVCTIMEYGSSETNSNTLTIEQKDLFYRHIWRAWDEIPQCPLCDRYQDQVKTWERDLESRIQFLASIRDGQVNDQDVAYFNELISESWAISAKLAHDDVGDRGCSDDSISEAALVDGCRLACLLEDIRLQMKRIEDPYKRLFVRRDILTHSSLLTADNNFISNLAQNNNNNSLDDYFDDSSFSH